MDFAKTIFLLVVRYNYRALNELLAHQGEGSSARNSSARKPVFQANF